MSRQARFRFHGNLTDFLSLKDGEQSLTCTFNAGQSVKHLIEALGVPHTEVERVLVNGEAVDFSYQVRDGDQVEVFPFSHPPKGERRFILDNHLGRLAVYLRMLGFDALYRNDYQDEELAKVASQEGRILLSRDRRLLMRNQVKRGYWIRNLGPRQQLMEVLDHFDLKKDIAPFRRCMRCNAPLETVAKEQILEQLQPLTRLYFDEFRICPACRQVYWKGSHYERMQRFIQQVLNG